MGIIGRVLSFPGGMLADKFSRKPLIFISRFISPFIQLGLFLLRDFNQILLLHIITGVSAGLSGGGRVVGATGGPAWNAMVADLVPARDRGKALGLLATIAGLASMPSSAIGGYLWISFTPDSLLLAAFFTGISGALIFLLAKEPKVRES
jgi:MFS family permease